MEITFSSVVPLVLLVLHLAQGIQARTAALCSSKCASRITNMSIFMFSSDYLGKAYNSCYHNCFAPNQGGFAVVQLRTDPPTTTTTTTTRPPVTIPPIVWTPRPTRPPNIWTPPPRPTPIVRVLPRVRSTPAPTRPPQIGCGYSRKFTSRIIGGEPADTCEFPWMVSIKVPRDFCGGFIIDKRHIVTAAHCMKDLNDQHIFQPRQLEVKVGSSQQSQLRRVKVKRLFVHSRHNRAYKDYDVAIIRLDKDLVFGPCISPICLPQDGQKAEYMDECTVAGWGILTPNDVTKYQPDIIQKVSLPMVKQAICQQVYGYRYFNEKKLCAGNYGQGGIDSCLGDSGGPLMCRNGDGPYTAHGIVSFGNSCAHPDFPGVYTRVNHPLIMKFILQSINTRS